MIASSGALQNGFDFAGAQGASARTLRRPSFLLSDLWQAPLHDFPIRDEILYQFLPFSPEMHVLEIGPGCGFTAFRLARQVRRLRLVDVSAETVADLRRQFQSFPNVDCFCADLTAPGLAGRLGKQVDAAFGLDVFEYLADPAACLANLADVLRPGGELLLTFPNLPPPEGDGVTYFSCAAQIERMLDQAGFRSWRVFTVRLRPLAGVIYQVLHEVPLGLLRQVRQSDRGARPQTYEATWAFQHHRQLVPFKVPLHLYWFALQAAMRLPGDIFAAEPATAEIIGRQLVIRATR